MNKTISLSDTNYFRIFIGKRVLKEEIFGSTGTIPIYSANVFKPLGYSNTTNIINFEHNYLIWSIDGNFEFNIMGKGKEFATTDHCGAIEILDETIIPEYLLYQLRLKSHILGFDRTLRSSLKNMKDVEVEIPESGHVGKFNIAEQKELSNKYRLLESTKDKIVQLNQDISEVLVNVELDGINKSYEVQDIFDFPETNSGITKEFCIKNKGDIPVYASSKIESSVLGYIKDGISGVKYYHDSLTWNRNGAVGCFFYRKGKFSTNEDHRVLSIKENYHGRIDPLCIRYILQTKVKELGFGFTNKLGSKKLATVQISLPVNADGEPSITKQQTLKQTYEEIDRIKFNLMQDFEEISSLNVELSS